MDDGEGSTTTLAVESTHFSDGMSGDGAAYIFAQPIQPLEKKVSGEVYKVVFQGSGINAATKDFDEDCELPVVLAGGSGFDDHGGKRRRLLSASGNNLSQGRVALDFDFGSSAERRRLLASQDHPHMPVLDTENLNMYPLPCSTAAVILWRHESGLSLVACFLLFCAWALLFHACAESFAFPPAVV